MNIILRQETEQDYNEVFNLIEQAFNGLELSDHKEQFLVKRLRNSNAFVPELSLVAVCNNIIVGHILLTKIKIINKQNEFQSLALAPVSVLPKYQKQGIGAMLIKEAHKIAKELGFKSVILLGHADYYPKFGYKKASEYQIKLPFEAPNEYCMALELIEHGLKNTHGMVKYPKEFFE